MLKERIQTLSNFENSRSQDDAVITEQEEEEKFDFDSNILDISDGAIMFLPDAKRDHWVILLKITCLWKLSEIHCWHNALPYALSLWSHVSFKLIDRLVMCLRVRRDRC